MNRAMRTFYTTMGIVLILLFMWVGSYLSLRTWKGSKLDIGGFKLVTVVVPERALPFTLIYRPWIAVDKNLTEFDVNFLKPDEFHPSSGRFKFTIGAEF